MTKARSTAKSARRAQSSRNRAAQGLRAGVTMISLALAPVVAIEAPGGASPRPARRRDRRGARWPRRRAPDDLKRQGDPSAKPAGHGEGRKPEPVEGACEPGEAPLALGDLRRVTLRGVGEGRRGLGNDRHGEDVGLREHITDERSAETRAQPQGLKIVVRRDAEAQLEACPHDRLDLLGALADEARVHRGALAPRDDVADVGQDLGIGHAQFVTRAPSLSRSRIASRTPAAISSSSPWKK